MAKHSIGPKSFRQWLQEQDEGVRVGETQSTTHCPLAWFLRERDVPGAAVSGPVYPLGTIVAGYYWQHAGCMGSHQTPRWAREFIKRVDKLYPVRGADGRIWYGMHKPVTREQALSIMDAIA
jgi:hypothetical protein